jgi:hypothetical protein
MSQVARDFDNFGYAQMLDVSADKTLDDTDCGLVQNVTATKTITLPATVVGYSYTIRVGAEDLTVTVAPNASDKIAGNGFTAADNKALIFTSQPTGSYVSLVGDGVNGWMVTKIRGTATRAA